MIQNLPIRLAASAAEPGFSLLVRNAAANAANTTKEFCATTGLNKALVCAGDTDQLNALAALTGSDANELHLNSLQQVDRKTSMINGSKMLTRSLRKADLAVCPQCWLEQLEAGRSKSYHLSMNSAWLPRPVRTCLRHRVKLVELPYKDYTTCYDHPVRSKLQYGWLNNLTSMIEQQNPSAFEVALLKQVFQHEALCPWLDDAQVDVFERWSLGLGFFIERGAGRVADLDQRSQRQMIDIGYRITTAGKTALHVAVDQALGKHGIRLGKTWLYTWAFQNLAAKERLPFRRLMKEMCDAQGDHCLLTVAPNPPTSRIVDLHIRKLARHTGRSASWVRHALITDGHLQEKGLPEQRNISNRFGPWRSHIVSLHHSLSKKGAAEHLGLGIAGFENLVKDGVLHPVKSQVFAKPKFNRADLDALMAAIQKNLPKKAAMPDAHAMSISTACFATSCATSTIINLLIDGHLKSAISLGRKQGLADIVIDPVELRSKLASFSKEGLSIEEMRERLGLQYKQVKRLIARGLLPGFAGRKTNSNRKALLVDPADLTAFLEDFQTIRTAASRLGISENAVRARISGGGVARAVEGEGMPIYRTAGILAL
ncbi:MAG: TniQ family protein [Pseudomonadota bacterium]